jgi:hypothetical protein
MRRVSSEVASVGRVAGVELGLSPLLVVERVTGFTSGFFSLTGA